MRVEARPRADTKRCSGCSERKPLDAFSRNTKSKDGHESECKVCSRARVRCWAAANRPRERRRRQEWARANPEKERARYRRWAEANPEEVRRVDREQRARRQFGLTLAQYDALIAKGCAICGTHEGQICVDHDHATGVVRDALCHRCNTGLGLLKDDPERVRAALEYLERHRS